jgi:hypothetical protein
MCTSPNKLNSLIVSTQLSNHVVDPAAAADVTITAALLLLPPLPLLPLPLLLLWCAGYWKGTLVAVKTMMFPAAMSGKEKREKMAIMETAISASLSHPNIVQVGGMLFVSGS